jgi:hypothetical protein
MVKIKSEAGITGKRSVNKRMSKLKYMRGKVGKEKREIRKRMVKWGCLYPLRVGKRFAEEAGYGFL